jgi:putative transposase
MPDHLHLFCAPRDLTFTLEDWMKYWKSQFSRAHLDKTWGWQRASFHHRIRSGQEFSEKWAYVQENPVRKGLVKEAKDWPFRGKVFEIGWV